MRFKIYMVLTFFFLIGFSSNAQSIKIYGNVNDSIEGVIPGATVMLMGKQDSILKSFAITDRYGNFIINNVKVGDYIFKVNFFGYESYEQFLSIGESTKDTTVQSVTLFPQMLDEVEVTSDYIPIRIKGDTIEYDSRAFETGEHDVVEKLLEQLPGVEVQPDGTIKVQGKTVEKILVDGEEFFGNDPTIAVKNLPAGAVDKVQVYDKDSDMATFTGVEDGEKSTTINLTLKEDHKKGYFGNIDVAYGDANRYKLKGNLHYFKNKTQTSIIGLSNNVNETGFSMSDYIAFMGGIQNIMNGSGTFSGNSGLALGMGQNNGFLNTNATGLNFNYKPTKKALLTSSLFFNTFGKDYDKEINRVTYFTDSSLFSNESLDQEGNTFNNRMNAHYKQEFNTTNFLNVDVSANWTKSNYLNDIVLQNLNSSQELRNDYTTNSSQNNFLYGGKLSADYRKKFKKKGRYTGGGLNYELGNESINTTLMYNNTIYGFTPLYDSINQSQNELKTNTKYGFNWMYSEPLSKKQLIQLKAKYDVTMETRDKNVVDKYNVSDNIINNLLSGTGSYSYTKTQVDLRYKYISKKLKTTAGISLENVNMISELFESNRSYDYLLPYASLRWDVTKSAEFRMFYDTRVNMPSLLQLQVLPNNSNPAEIILGNTILNPEYVHSIGLEYELFNQFNFTHFMAQVEVAQIQNKINYAQTVDNYLNRVFTPENIGNEEQLNSYFSFGTNINPLKTKFSLSNSSNLSKGQLKLNGVLDNYISVNTNSRLIIENIKKKVINVKTGLEVTYSNNSYESNPTFNSNFYSWNYMVNLTLKLKGKWEFNSNMKHYFYPGFSTGGEQIIINSSIARNFLESKKLQVYVSANDILNQNTGISQSYYLNYYEKEKTATLGRYFLLGLKFSFNKLGK